MKKYEPAGNEKDYIVKLLEKKANERGKTAILLTVVAVAAIIIWIIVKADMRLLLLPVLMSIVCVWLCVAEYKAFRNSAREPVMYTAVILRGMTGKRRWVYVDGLDKPVGLLNLRIRYEKARKGDEIVILKVSERGWVGFLHS